jgi:hypothetical protein
MKTFLKIYISLCLILSPIFFINSANAATVGGWTLGGLVADGASSIVNGTKQVIIDGKNYIKKGTAIIKPNATQVAKVLRGGAAGYALSIAVEQILGSVDWVLDPANNQIVYSETSPSDPTPFLWQGNQFLGTFDNPNAACKASIAALDVPPGQDVIYTFKSLTLKSGSTSYSCSYDWSRTIPNVASGVSGLTINKVAANPDYSEDTEKSIPLDVVAQKVISNAESGDTNAQVATTAAAQQIINDAQQDESKARPIVQQLEASASTENADSSAQEAANEATGTSQPNTANPALTDLKLSFPVFCGWAPVVCEAAQVAIQFPARVQTWVNQGLVVGEKIETEQKATTAEAAKTATATQAINQELTNSNDLPQKDTSDIVLPDLPITPQSVNVNWGNACPPPTTATLAIFGQSTEITLINYDPICEWAWVVEYSVIALASISSVFIVAGRKS